MSDVTTINILTWSGMSTAAHRNVVIADLLPEPDGIANLVDETKDRIKSTYIAYAKRTNNAFNVSHTTVKRLTSLMYWVQDKERTSDSTYISKPEPPEQCSSKKLKWPGSGPTFTKTARKSEKAEYLPTSLLSLSLEDSGNDG